jgi:hypothetical protein
VDLNETGCESADRIDKCQEKVQSEDPIEIHTTIFGSLKRSENFD